MRWLAVIVCAACGSAPVTAPVHLGNDAHLPPGLSSHLASPWVVVEPDGPRFMVPARWRERGVQLHLTRPELEQLRAGAGEYHAEMAEIVDASLPFQACAFAGGDAAWSELGGNDTQLRVYVVPDPVEVVERWIEQRGGVAASAMLSEARAAVREKRAVDPNRERKRMVFTQTRIAGLDPWREDKYQFELSFADGAVGPAVVHFFVRELGGKTVVVVMMYRIVMNEDPRIAVATMKL